MLTTPLKMKRMKLRLIDDDAQIAANVLAKLSVLHLEEVDDKSDVLSEYPASDFHDIYNSLRSRYKKIIAYIDHPVADSTLSNITAVTSQQLMEADEKLRQLWSEVSQFEEQQRELREQSSAVSQLMGSLERFLNLDIDLKRLGKNSRFLNVQSGVVSSFNTDQLKRALSINGYVLERFFSGEGVDYVVIVGSSEHTQEVEELLRSADFRELSIPEEFTDHPQKVSQRLGQQQQALEQSLQQEQQNLMQLISHHRPLLELVGDLVYRAMPYAGVSAYLKGKGRLVTLQGWVPESRESEIKRDLQTQLKYPYQLLLEVPAREELPQVPTQLKENWLITPFHKLIGQFGLPQYGEYDPGILFALSYTLMFGMMFGDIGHGAVIMLGSLMLYRRFPAVAIIGGLAGLSSIAFGFIYGSLFGYEHVIHPLWMSPMEDPQLVLMLALYWGIGFLVIANLLAIRNAWAMGLYRQAWFSPQGVAGLVFYLLAITYFMTTDTSASVLNQLLLLSLIPAMAVMLVYQWSHSSGAFFERVLVVMIEGLEIIINSVSSTLSFLRVAAFSLNHIALATAVFAIAAMLDTLGHGVAIVLGNIFIIVLEGAIVAIQCLRLEYYEGFSRFFSGKGKPYRPLKIEFI